MSDEKPANWAGLFCIHYPDGLIVTLDLDSPPTAEDLPPEEIEPEISEQP